MGKQSQLLLQPTEVEFGLQVGVVCIQSVLVTRPTRSHLGATWAPFWASYWILAQFCGFGVTLRQHKYEYICFRIEFFLVNMSALEYRKEMVLYSKWTYGSQFSEEKIKLEIRYLVVEIFSKQSGSFFFDTPCINQHMLLNYII